MSIPPAGLTEWLRARPDDELIALLEARPDVAVPVPNQVAVLAARLASRPSLQRALERVTAFELELLDVLQVLGTDRSAAGPVTDAAVCELVGPAAEPAAVRAGLDRLREMALIWGDDDVHLTGSLPELLPVHPFGLGRPVEVCLQQYPTAHLQRLARALTTPGGPGGPGAAGGQEEPAGQGAQDAAATQEAHSRAATLTAVETRLADPHTVADLVASAPPGAQEVLRTLAAGSPYGELADALRPVDPDEASPVRWLLARGLLVAVDAQTVELPREVGLALRGDAPLGELHPAPPPVTGPRLAPADVDAAAAAEASTAVAALATLLDAAAAAPPSALRTGGLGVRDLRRLARASDLPEPTAALLLEIAGAAGLVGLRGSAEWLPTGDYDRWSAQPVADRWAQLVGAWWSMPRAPARVGDRDDRDRISAPLGPDVAEPTAPDWRSKALAVLASAPPATAVPADTVVARLRWTGPRRLGVRAAGLVRATLDEAAVLGVLGRGALPSSLRTALRRSAAEPQRPDAAPVEPWTEVAAALAALLPAPLDHVLAQADLTLVAPGPLEPDLARELALVADVESSGGATVYRVSETSVRRALDAGRSAEQLHTLFATRSRSPVPQALDYLIDDVARRHGRVRVAAAASYLRCDDPAVLREALASRVAGPLGLRALAPTVLVATAPVEQVLQALRGMGLAPVAESADGAMVIPSAQAPRAPASGAVTSPESGRAATRPLTTAQRAQAVREMRSGDAVARMTPVPLRPDAGSPGLDPLAVLQQAARAGRPVRLGYVNAAGNASTRVVEPIAVTGGYLSAYDHRRETRLTFSLHRVTGVAEVPDVRLDEPA